jgi:hypothetical protein
MLIPFRAACKGRVFDGPAVGGKELRVEPSRGYIICGERYADDRYALLPAYDKTGFTCTEGVWMSVTPTDDELIVALDFEGQADLFYYFLLQSSLTSDPTKLQVWTV